MTQQHTSNALEDDASAASSRKVGETQQQPPNVRDTTENSLPPSDDFLVEGLDDVIPAYADFDGQMYAGLLPMDNGDRTGNTMFWLFQPAEQMVSKSLVIWLNGGPGCSSFNCGVLMENSPVTQPLHRAGYCCLDSTPNFGYNEHTWTRATTMLYVEHPIGTGFSHGSAFPENEEEASGDLDSFLQNFLKVFQHLQEYNLFITGESYAGMFVPAIARYIHRANKEAIADRCHGRKENDRINVRLKGAALGNGWIDAKIQGPATIDYSWWHGLIDKPTRDSLHIEFANCMKRFESGDTTSEEPPPFHPFNVQDDCGIMWGILQAAGNPNAYDVTTWDPNVDQVTFSSEAFFNKASVKTAIHAPEDITWHGCRPGGGRRLLSAASSMQRPRVNTDQDRRRLYMDNDRPFSVVPYIAELVDDGIPVIIYNGDRDMTTNMVGSELALNTMDWSGKEKWLDSKRGLWMVDDYPAGWAKEHGNLTFVVVYNSGHMVPYNQPVPAFDLLTRLLRHDKFVDKEASLIRTEPLKGVTVASPETFKVSVTYGTFHRDAILVITSLVLGALLAFLGTKLRSPTKRRSYEQLHETGEISIHTSR